MHFQLCFSTELEQITHCRYYFLRTGKMQGKQNKLTKTCWQIKCEEERNKKKGKLNENKMWMTFRWCLALDVSSACALCTGWTFCSAEVISFKVMNTCVCECSLLEKFLAEKEHSIEFSFLIKCNTVLCLIKTLLS